MIVKGHEGHVISVSTAFKVHYNQKLGHPFGQFGGNAPWPLGDRRPWIVKTVKIMNCHVW